MADAALRTKCAPLYQTDGQKYTHADTITSITPLAAFPAKVQALFKKPGAGVEQGAEGEKESEGATNPPYIVTTPSTIFHAQGGGQPSDTGTFASTSSSSPEKTTFVVHQVRKVDPTAILHMGTFHPAGTTFAVVAGRLKDGKEEVGEGEEEGEDAAAAAAPPAQVTQTIDIKKRLAHSQLHTAGHVIGLAVAQLVASGALPADIIDGKASHYPGSAFVEFAGLIPSSAKPLVQDRVDELVARDLDVSIDFWDEARARRECTGVLESFRKDELGVRVVRVGHVGSYPCGGTHVTRLKECGQIVVRKVARQKGVSKISYHVDVR